MIFIYWIFIEWTDMANFLKERCAQVFLSVVHR